MEGKPITDYVNAANSAGIKKAYKFVPMGSESSDAVRQRAKEFLKVVEEKVGKIAAKTRNTQTRQF